MAAASPIKVAVMGPESTGKSAVSAHLAQYFGCRWVPEFARAYCAALTRPVTLRDELAILKGQLALEDSKLNPGGGLLICDTMFLTVKIWSQHMFGTYPEEVDHEILARKYNYFLIMNLDLPWEDDPLRDFPTLREHFLNVHIKEVAALGVPYALVSGTGAARFRKAESLVQDFLATS